MNSIESTKTAPTETSQKSEPTGRETLNVGIVLPNDERHPVGWLATRALGTEIEWRNGPVDIHWFVEQSTPPLWADDRTLTINQLPEDINELESELDVILGHGLANKEIEFGIDPAVVELTVHDTTTLLTRYLLPDLTQANHPAPSLRESIVVDVSNDLSETVATEIARHALSKTIPISLLGSGAEQSRFAAKLQRHNQTATDVGGDLDPDEFGALIQHAAVVVTEDPAVQHLAQVLHGRAVFIAEASDSQTIQRDLWSATSGISHPQPDTTLEHKIQRLAEIVEQTALLRLDRTISDRTAAQERERNHQIVTLHERQAIQWNQQRRRSKQTIDRMREDLLNLEAKLDIAENEADDNRRALRAQHNRLNQLEMDIAERDQGPARLQRSVDWSSVVAQIERDALKVLHWLRRQFGKG
ncbi:MAG: glycosyltransferase family 9 protein [Candidatus Poriferisodalaceae bacterium]